MRLEKTTDGIISRYINRKISTRISKFIIRRFGEVSPNKMTIFSMFVGIVAAIIYLFDQPILAGIMVQFASIIDGVDGEIARALNKESKFGAFLDSLTDRIVDTAILICFSIFVWRIYSEIYSHDLLLLIMALALSGSILVSYSRTRCEATLGIDPRKLGGRKIASRDIRLFIIFVGSVLGFYLEALIIIALLSYLHVTVGVVNVYRVVSNIKLGIESPREPSVIPTNGSKMIESQVIK